MKRTCPLLRPSSALLVLAVWFLSVRADGAELINDRPVTLSTARDVAEKRRALVRYVWGSEGFPGQRLPTSVLTNITSPVNHLTHLARVDELRIDLAPGLQGLAYHFLPEHPNREAVVVHHGHACTLDDNPSPDDVG